MAYRSLNTSPEITGETALYGIQNGVGISCQISWQSNLNKQIAFGGNFNVPDILKGQAAVSVIVPPTGYAENNALTSLAGICEVDICIHGARYENTFYTGAQVGTRDLGEGQKTITITKIFSIFGECVSATD